MLLVHSTIAISRENTPFQVGIAEWVQPTHLLLYHRDEEMLRGRSCGRLSLCFLCILFSFTFSSMIENEKFYPSSGVPIYLFMYLFITGPIIHDIHLCLRALASTDQSVIGGKHGPATESRLYSTVKSFGDAEEQNCRQHCFPSKHLKRSEPSLAPWTRLSKNAFVKCLVLHVTLGSLD